MSQTGLRTITNPTSPHMSSGRQMTPSYVSSRDWHKRNPKYREDKDIYKTYIDKKGKLNAQVKTRSLSTVTREDMRQIMNLTISIIVGNIMEMVDRESGITEKKKGNVETE